MSEHTFFEPETELSRLLAGLGDEHALVRQHARLMLEHLGKESIPVLLEALGQPNKKARLEAVKALAEFHDARLAPALAPYLMDEDEGISWGAAEVLIRQGREALEPVLEIFIHHYDSNRFREALHHILHVLKDRKMLRQEEIVLFNLLDSHHFSQVDKSWSVEIAWAAEKALEAIDRDKRSA